MRKIDELKVLLKSQAEKIRKTRIELKEKQRARNNECWRLQWNLNDYCFEFRHHHIAYCELRGKTRDQIEKPKEGHMASENTINILKMKYAWEIIEVQENK